MDNPVRESTKPAKRAACDRCHVLKSRCSRSAGKDETCDRCRRLGIECVSSAPLRTGRPRASGIGLTQGSSRRSNLDSTYRSSSRTSTPDTSSWITASNRASPEFQPLMVTSDQLHAADNAISHTNMQFPSFPDIRQSMVDSDFSSLDGSMFSEGSVSLRCIGELANVIDLDSVFDISSFTPMTTRSEDYANDQISLSYANPAWQSFTSSTPNLTSQSLSRSVSLQNIPHSHQMNHGLLPYGQISHPRFDQFENNAYMGNAQISSTVQDQLMSGTGLTGGPDQLSAVCAEIAYLHSLTIMSNATEPLPMVEDILKISRRLIDSLAACSDTTLQAMSRTESTEIPSRVWSNTSTYFLSPTIGHSDFMGGSSSEVGKPLFIHVASIYKCLIQMYGSIVRAIDRRLRTATTIDAVPFQNGCWMPHMATSAISSSPGTDLRHTSSSLGGIMEDFRLLCIISDVLQRLSTSMHTCLSLVLHSPSQQLSIPPINSSGAIIGQHTGHFTLEQLLSQEQTLTESLQTLLDYAKASCQGDPLN